MHGDRKRHTEAMIELRFQFQSVGDLLLASITWLTPSRFHGEAASGVVPHEVIRKLGGLSHGVFRTHGVWSAFVSEHTRSRQWRLVLEGRGELRSLSYKGALGGDCICSVCTEVTIYLRSPLFSFPRLISSQRCIAWSAPAVQLVPKEQFQTVKLWHAYHCCLSMILTGRDSRMRLFECRLSCQYRLITPYARWL